VRTISLSEYFSPSLLRSYLLLLGVFAVTLGAYAQSSQVSGQIVDPAKAAIPGVSLTLTHVETGEQKHTLSSDAGYFSFPLLPTGHYELTAEKSGFESQRHTGIVVETGAITTVDVTLQVGEVAQTVSVAASIPLLQTESSAVAKVVENQTIVDMPLLDRRAAQLQRLNGYVVGNGSGSSATFATAGGRSNNGNYTIDGGNVQNALLGTATLYFDPPVESLQEFNVAISNYAVELGRTGGAVVQMTTKSGTNQFHGSAYEYLRNDVLQATPFFATNKSPLRYNLFGASLGGPLYRNKTYFFFNYEGFRQTAATTVVLNVPSPAEVRGDFSADSYKVIDPSTGQPFPGNILPTKDIDPVGARLAAFYPAPNVPGAPSGKANFVANDSAQTVTNTYVARVDHIFSDKDRIFGRFLADPSHVTTNSVFPTPGTDAYGNSNPTYYYNASATWYHNFSPNLINEARLTYSQRENVNISAGAHTTLASQIGLIGTDLDFFPLVAVNGLAPLGNTQQQRLQKPFIDSGVEDNVTWLHGNHQVKFGAALRYNLNVDHTSASPGGAFVFQNSVTGSSLANLLLGRTFSANRQDNEPLHSRANSWGLFIQDDWRVTPRLTLNIGLRYDLDLPRWEIHNRQNSFDPTTINPVSGTPGIITFAGIRGVSKYANTWDWDNFGPRLGFAFRADEKTVIRGGAAVLYTGEYDEATPLDAASGFSIQGSFSSPDNGVTPPFYLRDGMPAVNLPSPSQLTPGFGAVPVGKKVTTSVDYFKYNRATGYLYQASLDIQRQIGTNFVIDIGTLLTLGHHLPSPIHENINQVPTGLLGPGNLQVKRPFPQFSNVALDSADIGDSIYNGGNIGIEKRYSAGLQFRANYTFSKFFDNLDARNELASYPGSNTFTNYYDPKSRWGLSGNDVRHRLVGGVVYDLPFGEGKTWASGSRWVNEIVAGWSSGVIGEIRSGTPLSPIELTNNTGSYSDGVRPDVVGDPALHGSRSRSEKLQKWFDTTAFQSPAKYTFGNASRTFGEGPGLVSLDASLLKSFRAGDKLNVQFRTEALNVLNHANFANPDTRNGSGTFGQVTSLVAGTQSRILQFGLHLAF
jgi:Carboxypeptidase regulatory-like domain/TonB dependent receptor